MKERSSAVSVQKDCQLNNKGNKREHDRNNAGANRGNFNKRPRREETNESVKIEEVQQYIVLTAEAN